MPLPLGLLAFGDVEKADYAADNTAIVFDRMRLVLYGEASAVFTPEHICIHRRNRIALQSFVNRTLLSVIARAISMGIMKELVIIFT